jgi:hypothetical protein
MVIFRSFKLKSGLRDASQVKPGVVSARSSPRERSPRDPIELPDDRTPIYDGQRPLSIRLGL